MGRKKHILPEQNYSFSGYFKCETVENIGAHFADETRAVSEAEALNNIRYKICKKYSLFYDGRPAKIELYNYTLKLIVTPTVPSPLPETPQKPIKKDGTPPPLSKKSGPRLPFEEN